MKLLFSALFVFLYVASVTGQDPAPLGTVEKFKTSIVPQIIKEEGVKHQRPYYLDKITSAKYIGKTLAIEVNFILNHMDKSMAPNLKCSAVLSSKIYL